MAQKTVVILSDDLDGSEYEIDLNAAHASELRSALERFANAGRRISGGRGRPAERKAGGSGMETKAVRMWALDNGLKVNTRGRIQQEILEKYQAAH